MPENSNLMTDTSARPSNVFVGRDADIEKIRTSLQNNSPICLYGMGGIGKTEICRKIFWDLYECTDGTIKHLAWIKYNTDLKNSFYNEFTEFNLNGSSSQIDVATYFTMVKNKINKYKKDMLLIIDDANEISKEDRNIIRSFACCVLLTSRKKIDGMNCFEIGGIESEDECVEMYKRYHDEVSKYNVSDEDEAAIREMVHLSGHHTITIELLGKLHAAGFVSAQELLSELKKEGFTLKSNNTEIETTDIDEKTIREHLGIHMAILLVFIEIRANMILPWNTTRKL